MLIVGNHHLFTEQTYEEMLANIQDGVRHKPKSSVKL